MEQNEALGIISGVSLLSLLIIGALSIPAWIPALLVLIIGTFLTGFDNVASEQLDRQYKEQQEEQTLEQIKAEPDFNAIKAELLAKDTEREILLRDLKAIGVDTLQYELKNRKQIEKSLNEKQRKELEELRSFLNDK